MAFGAQDVQPSRGQNFLSFSVALRLVLGKGDGELFRVDLGTRLARGLGIHVGAGHELGIAAQDDVGPAAGHVGRDGHSAFAASLRHHMRLALVLLGIEHVVRNALLA